MESRVIRPGEEASVADVTFVGTGEAFDPALPNTSLLYRGGTVLLIDCGYAVPRALWQLTTDPAHLDGIYLSHAHADHCFGLPALVVWMRIRGRSAPLTLLGGEGAEPWIRGVLELGYPGACDRPQGYSLRILELPSRADTRVGTVSLTVARSDHPVVNHALRVEESGRVFCYSGDGAPTAETRELFAGAHLLVHECYAAADPMPGHGSAATVIALAEAVGVETLCLVHLEQDETNKRNIAKLAAEHRGATRVLLPSPGAVLTV